MTTPSELPPDRSPRVRFERRDVNARVLLMIGVGTGVFMLLIHFGLLKLFHFYRGQEDRNDSLPSPLMTAESQRVKSFATLQEIRDAEQARLNSYAWIDREKQEVRIPIDRAMDICIEQGLPDWQPKSDTKVTTQQKSKPEHTP